MLKKRKYQKWGIQDPDKEQVDLKEVEKPMPALKKVERVSFKSYIKRLNKIFLPTEKFQSSFSISI